jgi:hypothetical protein
MPLEVLHATLGVAFLAVWTIVGEIIVRDR